MIPRRQIEPGFIEITGSYLSFFVSSIDDTFMEYLTKAVTQTKEFFVHQKKLGLKKVDILEEPEFSGRMKFKMLSPLLLIKQEGQKVRFIKPGDEDLVTVFAEQLVEQCNNAYGTSFQNSDIHLELDQNYMEQRRKVTRLLTIRNINYRTILTPIFLEGEKELIRFAYVNGIGAKTQYGLGMLAEI